MRAFTELKQNLSEEQLQFLRNIIARSRVLFRRAMYPYGRFIKTPLNLIRKSVLQSRNLEIGPGTERLNGFETVNVFWGRHVDYVADASRKLPFPNETFDLIYASHVLEHMPWYSVNNVLKEWVRTMKSGGHLELWVPDGLKIAKTFVEAEENRGNNIHLDGWYKFNEHKDPCLWANGRIFSYGDGLGSKADPNWHLTLFSARLLQQVMEEAGLIEVKKMEAHEVRGNDHGWINMGYRGVKP